jgi:hypothetical protein
VAAGLAWGQQVVVAVMPFEVRDKVVASWFKVVIRGEKKGERSGKL